MAGGQVAEEDAIVGINVTPLVDVTLVLAIVLMVTAKMVVQPSAVPLDLPRAATGSSQVQTVFSIELAADGTTYVDKKKQPNDDAIYNLARAAHLRDPELRAVIKADTTVQHGRVIHVLDLLKQSGVTKIAFGVAPTAPVHPDEPKK